MPGPTATAPQSPQGGRGGDPAPGLPVEVEKAPLALTVLLRQAPPGVQRRGPEALGLLWAGRLCLPHAAKRPCGWKLPGDTVRAAVLWTTLGLFKFPHPSATLPLGCLCPFPEDNHRQVAASLVRKSRVWNLSQMRDTLVRKKVSDRLEDN